jgi:spore germination protein YaaH
MFAALAIAACLPRTIQAGGDVLGHKGNFGISGWLVYWDPKSMQVFEQHADIIDRVYPEWYTIGKDGMPRNNQVEYKAGPDLDRFLAAKKKTVDIAHAHGIKIFSMIVNFDNTIMSHSTERAEMVLNDAALRKRHIAALVDNAVRDQADGIDIDYENMKAVDAEPFNRFMAELKAACQPHHLLLAAALAPKTDADGTWDGNQAHDYKGLSPSLNLIRPMTYDEHWGTSSAGPVSSPEFTEMVDRYAASVADPGKVELGLAGYGYDWKDKQGDTIGYSDYLALVKKHNIKVTRDEETGELTGRYTDEKGYPREFWFCDYGSYRPKYAIIKKYHLAGLALWRFGSEDPKFWDDVKQFKYQKGW